MWVGRYQSSLPKSLWLRHLVRTVPPKGAVFLLPIRNLMHRDIIACLGYRSHNPEGGVYLMLGTHPIPKVRY